MAGGLRRSKRLAEAANISKEKIQLATPVQSSLRSEAILQNPARATPPHQRKRQKTTGSSRVAKDDESSEVTNVPAFEKNARVHLDGHRNVNAAPNHQALAAAATESNAKQYLLRLPGELRNDIYRYTRSETIYMTYREATFGQPDVTEPLANLLKMPTYALTCRQLYKECKSLFSPTNILIYQPHYRNYIKVNVRAVDLSMKLKTHGRWHAYRGSSIDYLKNHWQGLLQYCDFYTFVAIVTWATELGVDPMWIAAEGSGVLLPVFQQTVLWRR